MAKVGESPKYKLNNIDWKKVGIGLGIAVGGVVLTYIQELIPTIDFGQWTTVAYAINSTLINLARKWLAGYR